MLSNYVISLIRTGVPIVMGTVLTFLATNLHVVLSPSTEASLAAVSVAVLSGAYYSLARYLEHRFPSNPVFKYLLGVPAAPSYSVAPSAPEAPVDPSVAAPALDADLSDIQ